MNFPVPTSFYVHVILSKSFFNRLIVYGGGIAEDYFRFSKDNTIYRKAYEKYFENDEKADSFIQTDEGVKKLIEDPEKLAFYNHEFFMLGRDEYYDCSIQNVFNHGQFFYSMILPKNSEFLPIFSDYIRYIQMHGIWTKMTSANARYEFQTSIKINSIISSFLWYFQES